MRLRWDGIIARLSYRFNFLAIRVSLSLTQISGMELTIDFIAHPTRFERVTFAFEVLRLAACQHRRAPDLDYLGARQLVTDP
jgi:hypothetical protein